jgi:GcrA cell cycle regulator
MQQITWAPEHSDALRQYFMAGLSFAEIADAINVKFNTAYSRNAAISRAKRMGLVTPGPAEALRSEPRSIAVEPHLRKSRQHDRLEFRPAMPIFETADIADLRRADVIPRHLSLLDLEPGDCRYPYGGDVEGEAITFCGHPQHPDSSYCLAHFNLSVGPGTASERAAAKMVLQLLEAE